MKTPPAIEQLKDGTFPATWIYNIVEDKRAFSGAKTPAEHFNGDCNKGLTPSEVLARWQETSRTKDKTTGKYRNVRKNGLGVLTGPAGGCLIAVDIDGADAEQVFKEWMEDDYPSVENPGTMSWRGRPTNRQLLYRMPRWAQEFFEAFTKAQLDKNLRDGSRNSEICLRYGGCYTVLPGSYHPDTKEKYRWLAYNDGQVAELPGRLLDWLMTNHSKQNETYIPAELSELLTIETGPITGKNVPALARDFRMEILQHLVTTDSEGGVTEPDDPHALVWKLYDAAVWAEDHQPLHREHGNPDKPLVGGCPFHESQSGTSFVLFPDVKNEKASGLFGWKCLAEEIGGNCITLLHALRTGDIDAGWPDAKTLEDYCIEGARLLNKRYPEDFSSPLTWRQELKYDHSKSTLEWARIIEADFENPAEADIELARLAADHNLRWGVEQIRRALQDDHDFKTAANPQSFQERKGNAQGLQFCIPDVLLRPSTVLFHGRGGCGKSQAAMALARHIAKGEPFKVRGTLMPVTQGKVLWCNGDQNKEIFETQLESNGLADNPNFLSWPKFRLRWQARLAAKIRELKPALVVIDSLSGCMPGVDNNKQEITKPLYDLEVANGTDFPSTTIIIIHHNSKAGVGDDAFRGHTGIADAVTETWGLQKPTDDEMKELAYGPNTEMSRVIKIGKSRLDRGGDKFLTVMHEDFSMSIEDYTKITTARKYSGEIPTIQRVHEHVRTMTSLGRGTTRKEIEVAIGSQGGCNAVRSSLRRLRLKGLLDKVSRACESGKGRPKSEWYECTEAGLALIAQAKTQSLGETLEQLENSRSHGEREDNSFFDC